MAAIFGAALVAVSAQVAVPIPGTPIPLTLQVPAVLIVGGLLGPRVGAASMVAYLLAGMAGLPVFAPGSTLGMARLLGPTGGYLLAFPIAAAIVGAVTSRRGGGTIVAAAMGLGFVTIHIGGIAQLAVVTGDIRTAFLWGSLPFLVGDAIKLTLAGLLVWRFGPITRARL
jgi:biotin transport system substrate-specific component